MANGDGAPVTERGPGLYPVSERGESQWDMSSPHERGGDWGRDRLAEALDAEPAHTHDVGWGDGIAYRVGYDPDTASRLEVFPDSGVARITSQDAQITLFRQLPPSRYADRVRFEQLGPDGQLELTLTRRGRLRLDLTPALPEPDPVPPAAATAASGPFMQATPAGAHPDASETLATTWTETADNGQESPVGTTNSIEMARDAETCASRDPGGSVPHIQDPSGTPEDPAAPTPEPKATRLNLAGRLGRMPSFRSTRNGTVIASFPLAVRDEAGDTTWHTVLAFGDRAEQLREDLAEGQQIEVIGYLHQRERTTRPGETRIIDEIYATVVKPR